MLHSCLTGAILIEFIRSRKYLERSSGSSRLGQYQHGIMFISLERPFLLAPADHTSGVKGCSQSLSRYNTLTHTFNWTHTDSDQYSWWTCDTDVGVKELTWLGGENSLFLFTVHTTLGMLNWDIHRHAPSNPIWFDTMANFSRREQNLCRNNSSPLSAFLADTSAVMPV